MTDFKLSKATRSIIDNFSKINPSIVFRPGKLITVVSRDQDVVGFAEVEDSFPERFAIADLPKFLSILSLYEEPTLSIKDGHQLIIKGAGNRSFKYTLSAEKQIATTEKQVKDFASQFGEAQAQFALEGADLLATKKNMMTAGLPVVTFSSLKNTIVVKASQIDNDTSDVFEMTLATKSDKQFTMMFADRKIFNMLEYNYLVSVFAPMVRFTTNWSTGNLSLEYFNAPERGSKVME